MAQQQFDHLVVAAAGLANLNNEVSSSNERLHMFYQCEDCFVNGTTTFLMKNSTHWRDRHNRTFLSMWEKSNCKTSDQLREWITVRENRDNLNHHCRANIYAKLNVQYNDVIDKDTRKRIRMNNFRAVMPLANESAGGASGGAGASAGAVGTSSSATSATCTVATSASSTVITVIPSNSVANIVWTPELRHKLIKHVFFCNADPCKSIDCQNLRHQISHVKSNCTIALCVECASYHENILTSHVKICKNNICPVPKCLETRTINTQMVIDLTMD